MAPDDFFFSCQEGTHDQQRQSDVCVPKTLRI